MHATVTSILGAALLSVQPTPAIDGWRRDVAVARDEFLARDRSYTEERRAEARRRLDRLTRDIPRLSDQAIVAELARVAALADNAHSRAYLLRNRGWWRRYPLRIWRFADGWRVIAVRPGQEAMLGGRIVSIGGRPIAEAEAAVRPLYAGPDSWARYMAGYSLTSPDALLGTGVISGGEARFVVDQDGRRSTMRLTPVDEPRRTAPEENWWFLSPAHPATKGWVHVLAGRSLPAYLARPDRWYELRACDGGVFYLPFSRAEDQPGAAALQDFGKAAAERIGRDPAARLVVDLRFNTGGNLDKTRPFFEALARSDVGRTPGRLVVILGESTFSAGITPAAILKQDSKAIFVGAPPGDRLNFWAEGGNVQLPYSGITLHYADKAHLYGLDAPEIADELVHLRLRLPDLKPDRPVRLRFSDYLAGRDPATEQATGRDLRCEAT